MGFMDWWRGEIRSAASSSNPDAPKIPSREEKPLGVTPAEALGIVLVFRAVQIVATAGRQLTLDGWQGSRLMVTPDPLLRAPDAFKPLGQFLEETFVSLATRGNAYWLKTLDSFGRVLNCEVLNPALMRVEWNAERKVTGYVYGGTDYRPEQIRHVKLFSVPGERYGLGPIQQAQTELRGVLDVRDYAGKWFHDSGLPVGGYLSTEQNPAVEDARAVRDGFLEATRDRAGIPILWGGVKLNSSLISPSEAKWIEAQQFDVLTVTRMFGVPPSLMLAVVEGNSQTYQNVAQEWLGFVRFGLMAYLGPIEEAFSEMLPAGMTARFNIEGLLRADTATRYAAHDAGIRAGWLRRSEVRAIEGLPPIDGIDAEPTPAPAITLTPKEDARA